METENGNTSNDNNLDPNVSTCQIDRNEEKSNEITENKGAENRPIECFLKVLTAPGKMAAKHAASAPYHIFYTTITDSTETHSQPFSITFQEILDRSLGELRCSLHINFIVDMDWLLQHYHFAGHSNTKLTILCDAESSDLEEISAKSPNVEVQHVTMPTDFGLHHTKMMLLCYEDGSLRVVVSTANMYPGDWDNRTQGLWFSPSCPELPAAATPRDGESPTMFKRSLLKYLNYYRSPLLSSYVERVKRCDFSHINVFLVASVPGTHSEPEWGMTRVGYLLTRHCRIPGADNSNWPLIAQASSLGKYGKKPQLWLTGDFFHQFTRISDSMQNWRQPMSSTQPLEQHGLPTGRE